MLKHAFFYNLYSHLFGLKITLIMALLCMPVHAGIYKWIDAEGNTHYGEQPQQGSTNASKFKLRENTTTTPRISKEDVELERSNQEEIDFEELKKKALEPPKPTPIPTAERSRRCQQARNKIAGINSRGRMRERNSQGDYIYLTESQRQQRLRSAKNRKQKYCR